MWPLKLSYHQRDWKKKQHHRSQVIIDLSDLSRPTRRNVKPFQNCSKLHSTRTLVFFFFWKTPVDCLQRDLGAGIIESRSALEEEVYRSFVSAAVITGYTILRSSLLQASFAFIYSPAWPLLCCCPLITVPRSMVSSFLFSFSTSPAHGSFGRRGKFLIRLRGYCWPTWRWYHGACVFIWSFFYSFIPFIVFYGRPLTHLYMP